MKLIALSALLFAGTGLCIPQFWHGGDDAGVGGTGHSTWDPGRGGWGWGWPWNGGPPHRPPPSPGPPIGTEIQLPYATYQGISLEPSNVNQYLGIRYAAPPLGQNRWRAPQEPLNEKELGAQDALSFKPVCLGYFNLEKGKNLSEDCLYLNVFAPANATKESKLPVWFFIQGGGYAGDTDENFNATEVVMRSGYGMVFVQINYRVGAFGFLASEKVRNDGDLNVGLLDQRKAMEWVQKYIHLFGGDPEHVVIHGDSAGAGSVAHHMTAYGGRDDRLFVGGIAESTFWPTQRTVAEMEFQFDRFAKNVSCPNDDQVMRCLRSRDTATLQGSDVISQFPGGPSSPDPNWYFLPVVDGDFSTDLLYNLFGEGKIVKVPLIVGDDTDEGTGFAANANSSAEFLDFIDANYPKLGEDGLRKVSQAYPQGAFGTFVNHGSWFPAASKAYGEATFVCPGIEMSNALTRYNSPTKVWNYRYNVQDQSNIDAGLGVPHVSEKPAIFGPNNAGVCVDPCSYETYNAAIVPVMMDYWISFILALDPNAYKHPSAPQWENWESQTWYGRHHARRLKIETNATQMEQVPREQLQRCEMWRNLAQSTEQ